MKGRAAKIPAIIWQTSRERVLTEEALGCRDLWLERSPGWYYRMMDDPEAREFVQDCYPGEIARIYDSFPLGVMRADFWRVLILHYNGGLYTDTDTVPLVPPDEWITESDSFLCGAEADGIHLCNWTFAATPDHPALSAVIDLIVERAAEGIDISYPHFVHRHTGPGVFRDGVKRWLGLPDEPVHGLIIRSAEGRLPEGTRILDARAFDGGFVKHFFASMHWPEDYVNWRKEKARLQQD